MRLIWKIFRALVSVLLLMAVLLPAAIYVLLSLDPVQRMVRDTTATQLTDLLGAEVTVKDVNIYPFNRATVEDICLAIDSDTVARIETVSAGFELWPLISKGEIVVDYALLDGVELHVSKLTPDNHMNIQPIIDRLKSDRPSEKKKFQVEISTVIVRRASATYDVLSEPMLDPNIFDRNHIAINDLAINAFIPEISDKGFQVNLDHLSFTERAGFILDKLTADCTIAHDKISLENFVLDLPETHLAFRPINIHCDSNSTIERTLRHTPIHIATDKSTQIYPPDFESFVPLLSNIQRRFELDIDALACLSSIDLSRFRLIDRDGGSVNISFDARVNGLDSIEGMNYRIIRGAVDVNGAEMAIILPSLLKPSMIKTMSLIPDLRFTLSGEGSLSKGTLHIQSEGTPGVIDLDLTYFGYKHSNSIKGQVTIKDFEAGLLTGQNLLGTVDATADFDLKFRRKLQSGSGELKISKLEYNGYTYRDIAVKADLKSPRMGDISISISDPAARVKAYALYNGEDEIKPLNATATITELDLDILGLSHAHPGYRMSGKLLANIDNTDLKKLDGNILITNFRWTDERGHGLKADRIQAFANSDDKHAELRIESPFIDGALSGHYDFSTLVPDLKSMLYHFMPSLRTSALNDIHQSDGYNDFTFDFTIYPTREISEFFRLSIQNLHEATLSGKLDSRAGYANIDLDIPYLYNGKIIKDTDVFAQFDIAGGEAMVYATTHMPTKKGPMTLATTIRGADNRIDTHIDWALDRLIPINGTIDFSANLLSAHHIEGAPFPVEAILDMRPGTINFGDDTWHIETSRFHLTPEILNIDKFALDTGSQRIEIDGNVSRDTDDSLVVMLDNVSLLPIFETLEIDKALIGGHASGRISASDLLSGAPRLYCPVLHVDSIGYNRCTIGNADITANWDNERKGVYLDASITGFEGKHSRIDGFIFPMNEALDINFAADSVPVSFLKPFMEAFASDISGRASGHCRLFGTFKEIDLEGDIYADNVGLRIDFTNTTYHASDSVHLRPGHISLDNIIIHDPEGNTARLSGSVGHTFFKAPTFDFRITHAHNFLSYNVTEKQNPDWYGTIYGNGGANITGRPGVVDIKVNMSTAPKSTFTFVLSDRLDAEDYSFLTFRDATPDSLKPDKKEIDDTPLTVRKLEEESANQTADEPSQYIMDIAVTVTPDARLRLVMDPAGKDDINTIGSGDLHMVYRSTNNDLNMWGKYIVQSGKYHFTLQDIIIKDFIIKEGSEIQFDGDPYGVKAKLSAYYPTNANLSDLDESFLQDKEVARTNVPVHALMQVSGDIRQPVIDFDLEFPTLTQDTYRKVRSIVSTEDMMNRQIIYLLALNRFYTPDYMESTTKGDELFSVASSTISSQLSNLLGKLSDNWSIAPNLRSDRGDFSDLEVDLALSSRLLNNRLIFNGNFGYRDNTLNTNQFVGDFDIEYLLNKRGTWRLKAYNRYNDRNFYVRSAQTTQGVGLIFRRDFDKLFNFLRPKKTEVPDTTKTENNGINTPTL